MSNEEDSLFLSDTKNFNAQLRLSKSQTLLGLSDSKHDVYDDYTSNMRNALPRNKLVDEAANRIEDSGDHLESSLLDEMVDNFLTKLSIRDEIASEIEQQREHVQQLSQSFEDLKLDENRNIDAITYK